ncbi:MAG: type II secretion system minor pseudopilin GspJ [Candidatus Thiodiazotropha sp. (ex Monitilora ramsayi)]|nr:type II secretion system minor pseudopilin GspJ [Candidatus Thiodiazotropha sp. (ex Monitilora ramsayi)]
MRRQYRNTRQSSQGFTLLELLIAVTIFAIIATFVYAGLDIVLDTKQQTDQHLARLSKLQLGLHLLQRDIEQSVNRPVRDQYGDSQPALRSGGLSDLLLELTRGGHANPLNQARSSLQRVAYQLEDEALYRIIWPTLDRAQESEPRRQLLFDAVKGIEFIYYDQTMKKSKTWPSLESGIKSTDTPALPKAIEVIIELDNWGKVRRLFRVAQTLPVKSGGS